MRLDDGTSGIPLIASLGTMIRHVAKCHQPGMLRPSAFAVLTLIASSNLVGC
jgi:hypothetical protein